MSSTESPSQESLLLKQLAATEAVVWSPYDAYEAAQVLSDILAKVGWVKRSGTQNQN